MKRVVGYAVGLAALVLVLFIPAALFNVSVADDVEETTSISSYVADLDIAENGDLTAVETLTVDFPDPGKHGIFRFWDTADPSAPTARRIPHDISVTLDGADVPVELLSEDNGRFKVAKIGSASSTVTPGEHVYVVSYTIDGVLEPSTDTGAPTQLYWQLVPGGWKQEIDSTDLTVHLPAASTDTVLCAVGADATDGCTAEGAGTDTLHVSTGHLAPNTPVTIKAGMDLATPPPGDERMWSATFDPVFGPNALLLAVVLLVAAAAAVAGAMIGARSREPKPQYPLMYAPPEGIGPAQAAYIFTEKVDDEQYVATLMHAAEKGAVSLDRDDGAWTIADKAGAAGWAGLDPVTSGVAHILGGPGTSFTAGRTDVEAGKRLKAEISSFRTSTHTWGSTGGFMTVSGLGSAGGLVVIGGLLAALAVGIFNPFGMSMIGLVPGAFAVCAMPLLSKGSGTRRTRAGRDLWSRVGGFHRVLSTPSSVERFDFSGRQELYTAYIPWAVALGCADEWSEKYRVETGGEPPVPAYFAAGYVAGSHGSHVNAMVDDFSSTVNSAISSYQATQTSSSSGGGGGFSGGGGGGGGGGGSW